MKTQGIKIDEGAEVPTRFASNIRLGYTDPGCFGGRVWTCLIPKELAFLATTESPEQYVGKGVSSVRSMVWEVIRSANMTNSIR